MAGLTHLRDLYSTKGTDFINNLFSKDVYVTEKIDGSRFAFKKEEGELVFYKRNSKTPMNMVDRTIIKFYEPAISHIESLNLNSIPSDAVFGFEYFANSNPGSIVYDKLPENGLILTDINKGGTYTTDVDELIKFSKKLKTSPPPVIHNGKLSKKQIEQLTEFLLAEWEELLVKFKTQSFTSYIISILNPKLKNTALNIGTTKPIEGIVFSFNDGGSFVNAKVVDPLYTQQARERAQKRVETNKDSSQDKSKQIIRDLVSFIKDKADSDIKYKGKTKELRYIELLSDLFYQYYEKNKGKFKGVSAYSDDVEELDVNYNNISHSKLKSVLKSDSKVKTIFKIYLTSFGKTRTRATNMLDKSTVSDVNTLIPKMKKLSESTSFEKIMENKLHQIIHLTDKI